MSNDVFESQSEALEPFKMSNAPIFLNDFDKESWKVARIPMMSMIFRRCVNVASWEYEEVS